jgi:hypothetical protein
MLGNYDARPVAVRMLCTLEQCLLQVRSTHCCDRSVVGEETLYLLKGLALCFW